MLNLITLSPGADIRSVCTEAGMYAIRARRKTVTEKDFLDAVNKVIKGYQKFSATPKYMVYNWVCSFPFPAFDSNHMSTFNIFPVEYHSIWFFNEQIDRFVYVNRGLWVWFCWNMNHPCNRYFLWNVILQLI